MILELVSSIDVSVEREVLLALVLFTVLISVLTIFIAVQSLGRENAACTTSPIAPTDGALELEVP